MNNKNPAQLFLKSAFYIYHEIKSNPEGGKNFFHTVFLHLDCESDILTSVTIILAFLLYQNSFTWSPSQASGASKNCEYFCDITQVYSTKRYLTWAKKGKCVIINHDICLQLDKITFYQPSRKSSDGNR